MTKLKKSILTPLNKARKQSRHLAIDLLQKSCLIAVLSTYVFSFFISTKSNNKR
ncbi:hypothetical protein [Shewanella sp. SR44-3]|uniref:hypothetical protein n=1 Tax=unclassified Shewanella TaxID=196818 RepID=UPI0015F9B8E6|nr:hypothetical protein [Shewanella sp. SR44-3]MBB1268444.1 hypothetical protein [Shewanella sp. SR44-3]